MLNPDVELDILNVFSTIFFKRLLCPSPVNGKLDILYLVLFLFQFLIIIARDPMPTKIPIHKDEIRNHCSISGSNEIPTLVDVANTPVNPALKEWLSMMFYAVGLVVLYG